MANSFLDKTGLTYLWGKIVALVNRKQDALTFDSTPTDNSTNPVTSGGVKAYVDANAGGGGDSPVESGSGVGSVQTAGNLTYATGDYSNAEGQNAAATGSCAHAEGDRTLAAGDFSHAEGAVNTQSIFTIYLTGNDGDTVYSFTGVCHINNAHLWCPGLGKHVLAKSIDNGTKKATLDKTIGALTNEKCEVYKGSACGTGSHVEGRACVASGAYSHAEGDSCSATALCAHAEGDSCTASGKYSHAEGISTTASGNHQHVEGRYNVIDTNNKYAHIIGIGNGASTSNRKNGFTVDWQGNGWYAGTVSAGTVENPAPVTNANDLATKAYVDANAGGDSPVESGSGVGSVQVPQYESGSETYTQRAIGVGSFAQGANSVASGKYSHAEGYEYYGNKVKFTSTTGSQGNLWYVSSTALPNYLRVGCLVCKDPNEDTVFYEVAAINTTTKSVKFKDEFQAGIALPSSYLNVDLIYFYLAAVGEGSHAEGHSVAIGKYSHAEGEYCRALKQGSHAEGLGTVTNQMFQHATGKFNTETFQGAFVVGVGSDPGSRIDGFTVDWNGNGVFKGKVTSHAYYSINNDDDLITKGYFDTHTQVTVFHEESGSQNYQLYPASPAASGEAFEGHFLTWYDPDEYNDAAYRGNDIIQDMYHYILDLTDNDGNETLLPLTKVEVFSRTINGSQYQFTRLVFGNNERVYVGDGGYGCYLESEYPYPSGE